MTPDDEIAGSIDKAQQKLGGGRVRWVHPDCGFWMLKRSIADAVRSSRLAGTGIVATTAIRALDALREAREDVMIARRAAVDEVGHEIVAAEIRQSLDALGRVVGTVYTDDILDRIFGQFCIGK